MNAPAELLDAADTVMEQIGSTVEYRINGTFPAVMEAINRLFAEFDPWGYGTAVRTVHMVNGIYEARVTRAGSCD